MNKIQDIPADIPEEQLRIRAKCYHPSGIFEEFKKEDIEKSIPDRFEQQVKKYPDRLAIKTGSYELTYHMLNNWANGIAQAVLERCGVGPEPVLLLFENDAPVISSMFGVLKAGKFYIALDVSYPRTRNIYIVNNSQANILVTNNKNLNLANDLINSTIEIINIDDVDSNFSLKNPSLSLSPSTYSDIVYTSGSTGKPKGVIVNHRNMLHLAMTYTNDCHTCYEDRISVLSSCSSAASKTDIYRALLNGAALFPFDIKKYGLSNLAQWLIQEKITIYHSVPMVFRQFIETLSGNEQFPDLRLILLMSDRVGERDIELYKKHFSAKCLLHIAYGSSETSAVCQIHLNKNSKITNGRVPLGYQVTGNRVSLFDDNDQDVDFNQVGEIVVKSRYLSPGYWQKPDITQAKFLPDPEGGDERLYYTGDLGRIDPGGCLFHHGRKDFQIKIRGHRIEVAEIEAALLSLGNIKESIVVEWRNKAGEQVLVAYIVPKTQPYPTVSRLRRRLSEKLPDYMIPSRFMMLHDLPLNPNGKLDRKSLPEPDNSRPELENPIVLSKTPTEHMLTEIWSEILEIAPIGIHDKFLELGGNSLLAARIISRVLNKYQVKLSLQSLLAAPTIAEMADLITENQAEKVDKEELDMMLDDLDKLTDKEAKELGKLI